MTLYRRTMTIIFESEEWMDSPVLMKKFSSYLHDDGISLICRYQYDKPNDEDYGLREVTSIKSSYDILINDKLAFTLRYLFRAKELVNNLCENGWDAEYFNRTEKSTKTQWADVPGAYTFMDWEDIEGEQSNSSLYPSLVYVDDGVELTTKIQRINDDAFSLIFEIRKEIETITDRKNIENSIVSIPANDMKTIKKKVVSALERISNADITYTVDCTTEILSSANYECSKETIDLVMGDD
tara:strand:- start:699 stop:1418 length:720 start_codon:yes stop_codon:yes gene_type:complete